MGRFDNFSLGILSPPAELDLAKNLVFAERKKQMLRPVLRQNDNLLEFR